MFNPAQNRPDENQQRDDEVVPAATYVLACLPNIKFSSGNSGKRMRAKFRILWAPPELEQYVGKHVWLGCGLNTNNQGMARMLGAICAGLGYTDLFDPQDSGQVRSVFKFRPIATDLKVRQEGKYKSNEWGKIYPRERLQPEQLEKMESWRRSLLEEFPESNDSFDGDPGPGDGDAPQGNGWDLPF